MQGDRSRALSRIVGICSVEDAVESGGLEYVDDTGACRFDSAEAGSDVAVGGVG
jgi:hypothetical protein